MIWSSINLKTDFQLYYEKTLYTKQKVSLRLQMQNVCLKNKQQYNST